MDESAYFRILQDDPNNEQVRANFIKWLDETGDPRAEIAQLMRERRQLDDRIAEIESALDRWNWEQHSWMEIVFPLCVRSPSVGRFYIKPAPEAPAYVKVGDWLNSNTIVGLIEEMKLFSEVPAGVNGTVSEICIGHGDPVEYNQVLYRLSRPPVWE